MMFKAHLDLFGWYFVQEIPRVNNAAAFDFLITRSVSGAVGVWSLSSLSSLPQINELCNVPVPVMLMPDDFKAYSKIKVDNHLFNK